MIYEISANVKTLMFVVLKKQTNIFLSALIWKCVIYILLIRKFEKKT